MTIEIEELIETLEGYGDDSKPLTFGLLKRILNDIKSKKEREELIYKNQIQQSKKSN